MRIAPRTLGLSFVHLDLAFIEHVTIKLKHCLVGFAVAGHLNKCEAFASARVTIADQVDRLNLAMLAEQRFERFFGRRIRQITYVKFLAHACLHMGER